MLIGLIAWFLLGCGVSATIADKDMGLFKWASSAPLPLLFGIAVMLWPYILWLWFKNNKRHAGEK